MFCPLSVLGYGGRPDDCCAFMADNVAWALGQYDRRCLKRLGKDMTPAEAGEFARELARVVGHMGHRKHVKEAHADLIRPAALWFLIVSALGFGVKACTGKEA